MAEVAPARGDPPPQQAQGGGVTSMIIRMGVMYLLMSLLRGNGKPKGVRCISLYFTAENVTI